MEARHRQPVLDSADVDADDLGDLFAAIAVQVVQHDDFRLLSGQLPNDISQLDRVHPVRVTRYDEIGHLLQGRLWPLAPEHLEKLPAGDAMQPHPEGGSSFKGGEPAPCLKEG